MARTPKIIIPNVDPAMRAVQVVLRDRAKEIRAGHKPSHSFTILVHKSISVEQVTEQMQPLIKGIRP